MSISTRATRGSSLALWPALVLALGLGAARGAPADPPPSGSPSHAAPFPALAGAPAQRGIALGLYSEDPDWSYANFLDEMREVGASHVALVVPYYIANTAGVEVFKHPRFTVPLTTVERTIGDARARGLEVFLFPILRVEDKSDGGWRGTLAPRDRAAFYANYREWILTLARFAERLNVPLLSIGSELASLDTDEAEWRAIIAAVRAVYRGALTYSANWDHYAEVRFFDALDYAGVTGYFELSPKERAPAHDPSLEELIHSWREYHLRLVRWQDRVGKPLLLTEVGYLSQRGTAARPWNEGADEAIDLELQRRCYEAFRRVWAGEERLAGAYFWNWFGWGGPTSKEYTPRGKPAAREVSAWYRGRGAPR